MGYKKGKGLGKNEQGRAEIVEASKQKGRRGLGMNIQGFEPSDVKWAFEKEEVLWFDMLFTLNFHKCIWL